MAHTASAHNHKLDLFKCIAIYGVVLAHIPLPGTFGWALCALAKFSVVLFFLTAGYYSWGRASGVLLRRAGKTGVLLLICTLGLLLLGCVLALRRGETAWAYLQGRMNPFFLKEILLYQVFPLPYAWPMWYLGSQLIVYLLWWVMTGLAEALGKKLPYNLLGALALGLLAFHLSLVELQVLRGLEPAHSMYVRNAWLDAFPFFALGAWMGEHRQAVAGLRPGLLRAGVLGSILLALAEFSRVGVIDVLVGTTLLAVLLLALSIRCPRVDSPLLKKTVCFCGRSLTFYIYALHVPIYGVMKEWQGTVPAFAWAVARPWLLPLLAAALSTLMAAGLYRLSAGRRNAASRAKGANRP